MPNLLAVLAFFPLWQDPQPFSPQQLTVKGQYVLTVIAYPFEIEADQADLIQWSYPPGVKAVATGRILKVTQVPPGDTAFKALLINAVEAGRIQTREQSIVIRNGAKPPPKPDPEPDPKPEGFGRLIIVEESADRTPAQAKIINQLQSQDQGYPIRVLDQDQQLAAFKPAVEAGKGVGLPSVVFCDDDWKPISAVKMPATIEAYRKLIEERKVK